MKQHVWGAGLCLLLACGGGEKPLPASSLSGKLVADTRVDLTWTDLANETGFRLERRGPNDSAFVEVATLGAGVLSYTDEAPVGGAVEYQVRALKGKKPGNPSNTVGVAVPLATQTATAVVDLNTLEVTFPNQPENYVLSATASVPSAAAAALDFNLTVENHVGHPVWNVKAIITSVTDAMGTPIANADGVYGGHEFKHFGNAGLDVLAQKTAGINFTGINTGASTLTVELEIIEHPLVLLSTENYGGNLWASDPSGVGGTFATEMDIEQFTWGGDGPGSSTNPMQGVVSLDGRMAYYGLRNQPAIVAVDLITLTPMIGPNLTSGTILHDGTGVIGSTRAVTMSPDGQTLYVTLMTGAHNYELGSGDHGATGAGTIEVVKLNRLSLGEEGRAVLVTGVGSAQGRALTLSADGSVGAIAIKGYEDSLPAGVRGRFYTVNTSDMTSQMFDVSSLDSEIDAVTISPDGTKAYVANDSDTPFVTVDLLGGGTITPISGHGITGEQYTKKLSFGPDGRVYWMTYYLGGFVYSPETGAWVIGDGTNVRDVLFTRSGLQYMVFNGSSHDCTVVTPTNDSAIDNPASGGVTRDMPGWSGHSLTVTPF